MKSKKKKKENSLVQLWKDYIEHNEQRIEQLKKSIIVEEACLNCAKEELEKAKNY